MLTYASATPFKIFSIGKTIPLNGYEIPSGRINIGHFWYYAVPWLQNEYADIRKRNTLQIVSFSSSKTTR